ncbi:MAG: hypothetical protein APF76_14550 [Desulfitibacter sp. BRH_c19]|nr:MAG: hypothetical protein APF76_14550 [Desulfitibacter sp. BRH_c19]
MKRDIIVFGALAGIIGNLVKLGVALPLYYVGLIKTTYLHIASGYHGNHTLGSIFSIINGVFSDFVYAAFLGVLFYIILRYTDMKYVGLKGIFLGGFIHVINNGVLLFGDFNKISIDDQTSVLLIIPTIIFGFSACWIIKRIEKGHMK